MLFMENVDKRRNVKVVSLWENVGKRLGARAFIAKPEFHSYLMEIRLLSS